MKTSTSTSREGVRPPTMEDVAREVGVAKMTVSRALSGTGRMTPQTRQKVVETAQRLGFRPNPHAQRLSKGRCEQTVALFSLELDLGVGTRKLQMLQRLLQSKGYSAPIHGYGYATSPDCAGLMGDLRRQKPRAIVCNTFGLNQEALGELLAFQDEGGIVVCYDYPVDIECDSVVFSREENIYLGTRHLLELGHRRVGFFTAGPTQPRGTRLDAFARALGEFELEVRDEWLFHGVDNLEYEQGGFLMAQQFLSMAPCERPTGLFMVNDYSASVFLNQMAGAGVSVPGEVSVVGFDDVPVAQYAITPITTMRYPLDTIVAAVVELLDSRLEARYTGTARRLPVAGHLVLRCSTAPPLREKEPETTMEMSAAFPLLPRVVPQGEGASRTAFPRVAARKS